MVKKRKKDKEFDNPQDVQSFLKKIENNIENAENKEDFEKSKLSLIKLYKSLKNHPKLLQFDDKRIELLRHCNVNLQFINRDDDIWQKALNKNLNEAYEEIIQLKSNLGAHPERYLIKPWIFSQITNSLQKIAELETSLPKELRKTKETKEQRIMKDLKKFKKNIQVRSGKTIFPQAQQEPEEPQTPQVQQKPQAQQTQNPTPFQESTPEKFPEQTLKPFSEQENPFSLHDDQLSGDKTINPFSNETNLQKNKINTLIQQSDSFETFFKPDEIQDSSSFEKTFRPTHLNNDRKINVNNSEQTYMKPRNRSMPDDNSIKTFWVRDEKEEGSETETEEETVKEEKNPFPTNIETDAKNPFKDQKQSENRKENKKKSVKL